MANLHEAQLRHARHYANTLKKVDTLYIKGGVDIIHGLSLLELEQANIEAGQAWAVSNLNNNLSATELCVEYALNGKNILSTL
jgi:hypothetical protein